MFERNEKIRRVREKKELWLTQKRIEMMRTRHAREETVMAYKQGITQADLDRISYFKHKRLSKELSPTPSLLRHMDDYLNRDD